ncbi:MAG: hypothetical protein ACO3KD_02605 [Gaiellales bacterium]
MIVRRGGVHPLDLRDDRGRPATTRATHIVVISEDAWNLAMGSVVGVPIVPGAPTVDLFHVGIAALGHADASLAQSFGRASLGDEVLVVDPAPVADAVAAYLGLDDLRAMRIRRPVPMPRDESRARQKEIHWADVGLDERKRLLVLSPDERNATAPYVTTLYTTSRDKRNRRPWQVPAAGGWVITGDLLVRGHRSLEHRRRPSPARASAGEMAEVASGVRDLLSG